MSKPEVHGDPLFQSLVKDLHKATRAHVAALVELRAYHFRTAPADCDKWRSAVLQSAADDSQRRLEDALHALNVYGWKLAPRDASAAHLAVLEAERWFQAERVEGAGWGPGAHKHREGAEHRVIVDGKPVTIVLHTTEPPKDGDAPQDSPKAPIS